MEQFIINKAEQKLNELGISIPVAGLVKDDHQQEE